MTEVHVGIRVRERRGTVVDRPRGSRGVVFVHYLAPVTLSRDGSVRGGPHTCVIYRPESPVYATSESGIFNSYIRLSTDVAVSAQAAYPLPMDKPFVPGETGFIVPILSRIQREWTHRDRHWEDAIRLAATDLFLHLSRTLADHHPPAVSRHADALRQARLLVHRSPQEPWTVGRMAELVHLKEAQFSVLYKHLFDRTPMDDVIHIRLDLATFYLTNHDLTLTEVAKLCGFADATHFSRSFRAHVGYAPSALRSG